MIPMHPAVLALAAKYGVPLAHRSVTGSHFWDGKDLGCFWQRHFHLDPGLENAPKGWVDRAAWDAYEEENILLCPALIIIPPDAMVHEIFHFVIAEPFQRDFPEYGLMWPTWERGATGGISYAEDTALTRISVDGLVDEQVSREQEIQTQILSWEFCCANQISLIDLAPLSQGSWSDDLPLVMSALRQLKEKGFSFPNKNIWMNM